MLHPDQFLVNEAWLVFKLNDEPIHAGADGDFDFLALMDAASCFILSSSTVPASTAEPSALESKRMLKKAKAHKDQLPRTLFIPVGQPAHNLKREAERQGVTTVSIPEDQLLLFIAEAREGFRERFGHGDAQ